MITLRKMNEGEFESFLARSIPQYASEKVKAGNWSAEEAIERSRQEHASLLPQGLATPDHHLYTIALDGEPVGDLWLAVQQMSGGATGFIYDVFIAEPFRRRGIAWQALKLLENEAARLSIGKYSLHVFGFNTAARALYGKLGYEITNINMEKTLSQPKG